MKLRVFLLSLGLLWLAAPVWADSAPVGDPRVIVGGGMGSYPVGETFLFGSPTGTSPVTLPGGSACTIGNASEPDCVFNNATNVTFNTLTFDVDAVVPPGSEIGCSILTGGPFTGCTFAPDSDGYTFTFTGGTGVLAGSDFSIEVIGWNPGTDFGVGANGMIPPDPGSPEPGTVLLMLTGIGALALAAKRKIARAS